MITNKYSFLNPYQSLFIFYFIGVIVFTILRIILAISYSDVIEDSRLIALSFLYGFRFDTCILAYILSLPFLLLTIGSLINKINPFLIKISFLYSYMLLCFAFLIACADVPFFNHFSTHISSIIFNWNNNPIFIIKMIVREPSFLGYLMIYLMGCYILYRIIKHLNSGIKTEALSITQSALPKEGLKIFLFSAVLLIGMRGRFYEKSPILFGSAYFCDNNFLNALALNPVYNFVHSILYDLKPENKKLNLIDVEKALALTKEIFKVENNQQNPVCRIIKTDSLEKRMNVVLVIMESMSIFNMGNYGGPNNITPNLDSLKQHSLWFENIFTQGVHTYNGIYATLFSYPALLKKQPMLQIPSRPYYSMPLALKEQDYETLFFITHDGQFDNVEGFLMANSFTKVFAEDDYPDDKILSTLGVPDDYLFEFSIPEINKIAEEKKNFFCAIMTGSNHKPYIFPEWIDLKFKSNNQDYQMMEYADWSIGKFIKLASKQEWYQNTLFVFVADHGHNFQHTYDMPLSFHHTPLLIFAPGLNLGHKRYDCLGSQMDIFPTLMGLMNFSYVNNTMGIDLLNEKRDYVYFTADDKIGCLDEEYYFIHRIDGPESLYKYKNLDKHNYISAFKEKTDSMRIHSFAMLQTAQWMLENQYFQKP